MRDDIFIHYSDEIPKSIRSAVAKNPDGYDVYISTKLTSEEMKSAYLHELKHIQNGDLERRCCVSDVEWEYR